MNQRDEIQIRDSDDSQFFEKQPPTWPRVVFIGFFCLLAMSVVAYSTFKIGSVVMAVIGGRAPIADILILLVLIPVAVLVQLP